MGESEGRGRGIGAALRGRERRAGGKGPAWFLFTYLVDGAGRIMFKEDWRRPEAV